MATVYTAEEIAGFKTLKDILEFAGVAPDLAQAFYLATGSSDATRPRVLGIVPSVEYTAMLATVQVKETVGDAEETRALKFAEKGQLLLVGEGCRACAGVLGSAPPDPSRAPSPGPAAAPSIAARKIKLSLVIRQADETEIEVCDEKLLDVGQGRWEATFGVDAKPDDNEDVTIEQISGVKWLIDNNVVPYLDFAIWGAYGHRMERKLRLSGQILDSAGKFRHIEIAGPPTLEVWQEAFSVMCTAFLFLDICDLGTLLLYRKKITDYHNCYGPATWILLYQADVRFRHEKLEKIRRQCLREHATARNAGGTTPFDSNRPWNYSYITGLKDKDWWEREFKDPAGLYLNKTSQLHAFIGGDAPVSSTDRAPIDALAPESLPRPAGGPKRTATIPPSAPGPKIARVDKAPKQKQKLATKDANGRFATNQKGQPLCEAFNGGGCGTAVSGLYCPVDRTKVHQCNLCLSNAHSAAHCSAGSRPKGDAKGGKGKIKGGGKKRHW